MRNYFFLSILLLLSTCGIHAAVPCFTPVDGENLWRMVSRFQTCFSDIEAGIESILEEVEEVCSCVDATINSLGDVLTNELSLIDTNLLSISDTLQELIISDGDAVCSCVDVTVNSVADVITSEIEEIKNCLIGTAITNAMIPYAISAPGLYYVCETLSYTGPSPVITITDSAFDVTLDLGGHAIQTVQSRGIEIDGAFDVVIKNGIIDLNPTSASTGLEAIAAIGAEGVYISDIVVDFGPDVSFLINNSVEVTIDRCHFDNNAGNSVGQPNPGAILINSFSRAVLVRDCDVYNPISAGYSVDITANLPSNNAEIRFERCFVRSDTATLPLYGFYLSGVQGSSIIAKDCGAQFTQTGFYNTTTSADSTGDPLVLDSCVATLCNDGFAIVGVAAGAFFPANKILLNCISSNNSANGFRIADSKMVLFRDCSAQNNTASGFLVTASSTIHQIEFEGCVASFNAIDGFLLLGGIAQAGFRFCTATNNQQIGFNCDTPDFTVIKDCLALHNLNKGIFMQSGTVFDTRSGTSADNFALDILGTGSAINYSMVSS